MKVTFGMYWQVYGSKELEIPNSFRNKTDKEIQEFIMENWDTISLPEGEYIPDSDKPDFENFDIEE